VSDRITPGRDDQGAFRRPIKGVMKALLARSSRDTVGTELLLRHCVALVDLAPRASARARLESALGPKLAEHLLATLAPANRPR
jgi:hypothetical protein